MEWFFVVRAGAICGTSDYLLMQYMAFIAVEERHNSSVFGCLEMQLVLMAVEIDKRRHLAFGGREDRKFASSSKFTSR
jgi:hypothetical protein